MGISVSLLIVRWFWISSSLGGNLCVDADSIGIPEGSCYCRGLKVFSGRGSCEFCGDVSCSVSYSLIEVSSFMYREFMYRLCICQGRFFIFQTNHPLIHFGEFHESVSLYVV